MSTAIIEERLAALDTLKLDGGSHYSFENGHCALELVAWLAGEPHSDAPQCVSPVLRRYVIRLNDRLPDDPRQQLKPFLPRLVGTAGDGQDPERLRILTEWLLGDRLPELVEKAGRPDLAAELRASAGTVESEVVLRLLCKTRDAMWELRRNRYAALRSEIEARVRAELEAKGVAAAAADAAADAVAAAVAAAAADADAVAAAVAVAAADAAAAAAAAAAADAAAAAAAAADADAAAAAAADGKKLSYDEVYDAVYAKAKPAADEVYARLIEQRRGEAFVLLERIIDPAGAQGA